MYPFFYFLLNTNLNFLFLKQYPNKIYFLLLCSYLKSNSHGARKSRFIKCLANKRPNRNFRTPLTHDDVKVSYRLVLFPFLSENIIKTINMYFIYKYLYIASVIKKSSYKTYYRDVWNCVFKYIM